MSPGTRRSISMKPPATCSARRRSPGSPNICTRRWLNIFSRTPPITALTSSDGPPPTRLTGRKTTGCGKPRCGSWAGWMADLIVVNGNPLENLKVLYPTGVDEVRNGRAVHTGGVEWTIKDGIPYHAPELLAHVKEIVAQARNRTPSTRRP